MEAKLPTSASVGWIVHGTAQCRARGGKMRFWKLAGVLSVVAFTPAYSQVDNAYEPCSDACLETAHKCLEQITANLSQRRADDIRTKCGDTLDICIFACQDAASAASRKRSKSKRPLNE